MREWQIMLGGDTQLFITFTNPLHPKLRQILNVTQDLDIGVVGCKAEKHGCTCAPRRLPMWSVC